MNANINKREKIMLGGYVNWLDKENKMLYDKEHSQHGIGFELACDGKVIFSNILTNEEKKELLKYFN